MKSTLPILSTCILLLVAAGVVFEDRDHPAFDEKEVEATIQEVGSNYVIADGIRYAVDGATEFDEGFARLSDLSVGDRVEIEYDEDGAGNRRALEIERADAEEDDDDEMEARGAVESITSGSLVVGGVTYGLRSTTKYEGLAGGLADLAVGDLVEIEYAMDGDTRIAAEIERADDD